MANDDVSTSSHDRGADIDPDNPVKVRHILKGRRDAAGDEIVSVFSYNPPDYAIYRTRTRLLVQFSDDREEARKQRKLISSLAPMRGQVNGLIDGWHSVGLASQPKNAAATQDVRWYQKLGAWLPDRAGETFKRACRYDRRVSDAIVTLIEDPTALDTAQTLLLQVKNDIIAERTSIARFAYVRWALYLLAVEVMITSLLASDVVARLHPFQGIVVPAWTAVAGGGFGALFSLAVGLKSREVSIDLQHLENLVDVLLRMLIGAIAGGVLFALLEAGFVTIKLIDHSRLVPGKDYSDVAVFLVGFVAGFLERLVPQLLNTSNFGTGEPAGTDTPLKQSPPIVAQTSLPDDRDPAHAPEHPQKVSRPAKPTEVVKPQEQVQPPGPTKP